MCVHFVLIVFKKHFDVYETVKLYFKRLVSCFAETNNAKHNVREFVRDVRELFF